MSAGRTGMSTGDVWVCQTIRGAQVARAASTENSIWAGPDTFGAVSHSPSRLVEGGAPLFQLSTLFKDTHLNKWKPEEPGSTDVMKCF